MSKVAILLLLATLILSACAAQAPAEAEGSPQQQPVVTMFKPPS